MTSQYFLTMYKITYNETVDWSNNPIKPFGMRIHITALGFDKAKTSKLLSITELEAFYTSY